MSEGGTFSILLIEDEPMIRMMIADMVETLGHRIAAEAGNIDQAMELARSSSFDLAILDMNLNGVMSYSVADVITARNLPFIFASGYDRTCTPEQYCRSLVLQKPFTIDALESGIDQAMQACAADRGE
jgi:CheY-like chemotaxis protein